MVRTSIFSLLLLCSSIATGSNAIIETNKIATLVEHADNDHDVMVVCDLDNTLIELDHHRGNDQWFSAMLEYAQQQGYTLHDAVRIVLPRYFELQKTYPLKLIEDGTIHLIEYLQRSGRKVMALTSRSLPLKERTVDQLARLGITFSKMIEHDESGLHGLEARYAHGVLFCGSENKGKVLMTFFKQYEHAPKKIIFVDDKHKYLDAVREHATLHGIEFFGIRYGGCDHKVDSYVLPEDDKVWLRDQLVQEN
jgi:FMN phosphatase YigB (HAD superfamily)